MSKDNANPEDNPQEGSKGSESPEGEEELVSFVKEELGKDVDSPEKAKKMIKDTFSHVGKFGKYKDYIENLENTLGGENQAITMLKGLVRDADGEEEESLTLEDVNRKIDEKFEKLEHQSFYADNPEYKPYRNLIEKFGDDPQEVVENNEDFQDVYEKLRNQDEGNEKSVLHSNKRVGQASDKVSESRDKLKEGDISGAADSAVDAVVDTMS